jgi:hypothetical protein
MWVCGLVGRLIVVIVCIEPSGNVELGRVLYAL